MKCFSGKKDKASFKYLDKASFRHFDKAERQGIFQASCQGKKTRHLSGTLTRQKDKASFKYLDKASFRHLDKAERQGIFQASCQGKKTRHWGECQTDARSRCRFPDNGARDSEGFHDQYCTMICLLCLEGLYRTKILREISNTPYTPSILQYISKILRVYLGVSLYTPRDTNNNNNIARWSVLSRGVIQDRNTPINLLYSVYFEHTKYTRSISRSITVYSEKSLSNSFQIPFQIPSFLPCFEGLYSQRNIFGILLKQPEIRLYLQFSDWFGTKRTSVWFHTSIGKW